jgi:hypothetical protein
MKKNTDVLVVAGQEFGLEIFADKINYMDMSQDQNAGQSCNMKISNKYFKRVEQFKYLGTFLTNQNSAKKEIDT